MRFLSTPVYALGCLLSALAFVSVAFGGPIRPGFDSSTLAASDDGSSGAVSLGFDANFYGQTYSQVYVNHNGNITFGETLDSFTPTNLASTAHPIIAPFFADVDTTAAGTVSYGTGTIGGQNAFVASWSGVGYYMSQSDKLNSFQVALIDQGNGDFNIEFNYDGINWETGDFSGGVDGLGGASARAGFAKGTDEIDRAFEFPGSGVNGAFLDGGPADTSLIANRFNSELDGRYLFYAQAGEVLFDEPIDNVTVDNGNPPTVPEPTTLMLAVSGGLIGSYRIWRRRKTAANMD